jgi:hypothetical protein
VSAAFLYAESADLGLDEVTMLVIAPMISQRVDEVIESARAFTQASVFSERELGGALGGIRQGHEQGPVIWELSSGLLGQNGSTMSFRFTKKLQAAS